MQIINEYRFISHRIGEAFWRPFKQDEKSLNAKVAFSKNGRKKFWEREERKGNVRYI